MPSPTGAAPVVPDAPSPVRLPAAAASPPARPPAACPAGVEGPGALLDPVRSPAAFWRPSPPAAPVAGPARHPAGRAIPVPPSPFVSDYFPESGECASQLPLEHLARQGQ